MRFMQVKSMDDLRKAMERKLKVRRIGSSREGTIIRCIENCDGGAIIKYPAQGNKGEANVRIYYITKYEVASAI